MTSQAATLEAHTASRRQAANRMSDHGVEGRRITSAKIRKVKLLWPVDTIPLQPTGQSRQSQPCGHGIGRGHRLAVRQQITRRAVLLALRRGYRNRLRLRRMRYVIALLDPSQRKLDRVIQMMRRLMMQQRSRAGQDQQRQRQQYHQRVSTIHDQQSLLITHYQISLSLSAVNHPAEGSQSQKHQ